MCNDRCTYLFAVYHTTPLYLQTVAPAVVLESNDEKVEDAGTKPTLGVCGAPVQAAEDVAVDSPCMHADTATAGSTASAAAAPSAGTSAATGAAADDGTDDKRTPAQLLLTKKVSYSTTTTTVSSKYTTASPALCDC
jgi:hypothetical protein